MRLADAEFERESRRIASERRHRAEVRREEALMLRAREVAAEEGVALATVLRRPESSLGRTRAQMNQRALALMAAEDRAEEARARSVMRRAFAREGLLDVSADTPGEIEFEAGSRAAVREMRENPNLSPERAAQDFIRTPFLRRQTRGRLS
jgi:hypothetical protein